MDINWGQIIIYVVVGLVSGAIGGVVSGFVLAFRLGAWKANVDSRLSQLERETEKQDERLAAGATVLDKLPVLDTQLGAVNQELKVFRQALHETRDEFVSRRECDLRHGGPN